MAGSGLLRRSPCPLTGNDNRLIRRGLLAARRSKHGQNGQQRIRRTPGRLDIVGVSSARTCLHASAREALIVPTKPRRVVTPVRRCLKPIARRPRKFTAFHPFQESATRSRNKRKSSATPAWFSAATVSPPPATDIRLPSGSAPQPSGPALPSRYQTGGSRKRPTARSTPMFGNS